MPYFKAKMHQIRFRLGQNLLEVLTALPQIPYLDLRGITSKSRLEVLTALPQIL